MKHWLSYYIMHGRMYVEGFRVSKHKLCGRREKLKISRRDVAWAAGDHFNQEIRDKFDIEGLWMTKLNFFCVRRTQFIILGILWFQGDLFRHFFFERVHFLRHFEWRHKAYAQRLSHTSRFSLWCEQVWASKDYLVVYSLFCMFMNTTLNRRGFGMFTVGTAVFHWL